LDSLKADDLLVELGELCCKGIKLGFDFFDFAYFGELVFKTFDLVADGA